MKIIFAILFVFSTSNFAMAQNVEKVHVIRSVDNITKTHSTYSMDKSENLINQTAWNSTNGIVCSLTLVRLSSTKTEGTFECKTSEGYKAQIGIDCSVNNNQENSAYMFFGFEGKSGNTGNFYVWCE